VAAGLWGFNFTVAVEGSEPAAFSTVIIPTVEIDVVECVVEGLEIEQVS
jgi:hypothetical protein